MLFNHGKFFWGIEKPVRRDFKSKAASIDEYFGGIFHFSNNYIHGKTYQD